MTRRSAIQEPDLVISGQAYWLGATTMPRIVREIVMHADPDFRDAFTNIIALIRDAYDRGAISWARRCELLDMLDDSDSRLFEVRQYEKPHPDPEVMCFGVFIEPSSAFLAEVGAPTWRGVDL